MDGWTGKLLRVDLSQKSSGCELIDPDVLHTYLGGRGFGCLFTLP